MSKANPFDVYKMPIGLTDGIDIALPTTPAVFKVKLPSASNEEFQMALMTNMNVQIDRDDEGNPKPIMNINPIDFHNQQKALFFKTCIVSHKGLPNGMDAEKFFATYPLAAKYIFETATELGTQADAAVEESLEKFKPSRNGKVSGKGSSISMTH